jgi:hypothetical protein
LLTPWISLRRTMISMLTGTPRTLVMSKEAALPRDPNTLVHRASFGDLRVMGYNGSVEKYSRDFKGVWIPKEIWLSEKLSLMEKVLFVEIHSLDNERGCFASNRHFSEFFAISERQIRNYVSALKKKGFVKVTITNRNQRVIRTTGKYARVPGESVRAMHRMQRDLVEKLSLQASGQVGRKFPRG